jgi:hypothetical protein
MSITVIAEVWGALRGEMDENNLSYAAEALVNVLIDNDFEAADIKEAFRRDPAVMDALRDYKSQFEEEFEEEEYEEDEDHEDDEW